MARRSRGTEEGNWPHSFSIEEAFHRWIRDGRLQHDYHYLEVGGKPVIIREAFIEFMKKEDASYVAGQRKSAGKGKGGLI